MPRSGCRFAGELDVKELWEHGAPMALPQGPNQRWSLDFVSDTLTDSRRFRILAVVDDFTRECIALVADTCRGSGSVVSSMPRSPDEVDQR